MSETSVYASADLPVLPTDDANYWHPYPHLAEAGNGPGSREAEGLPGPALGRRRRDDEGHALHRGDRVLERKAAPAIRCTPGGRTIGTMEGDDHRRVRGLAAAALSNGWTTCGR